MNGDYNRIWGILIFIAFSVAWFLIGFYRKPKKK